MEKVFNAYFLEKVLALYRSQNLKIEDEKMFFKTLNEVKYIKWNVYAKKSFGGPQQVLEYLGRYTHKVAITIHRILEITDADITFKYKDYKDGNQQKLMTLGKGSYIPKQENRAVILPETPNWNLKILSKGEPKTYKSTYRNLDTVSLNNE